MSTPLVTVVIPAYNHENFIGEAVESVLNQTFSDFELIVVDDGSTDKTGEIVQSYRDERLNYYYQENQDAYNTINRGINLASGKYISILNSDDVYLLDRLERLVNECEQNNLQCVFTDVIPISDQGVVYHQPDFGWNVWHQKNRSFYFQCADLYIAFLKGNFMVTTSNLFISAQAAAAVGPFSSLRYLHDYDFIFRVLEKFPAKTRYLHDQQLVKYRIHGGNTLGEAAITGRLQDQELIRKYLLRKIASESHPYVEAASDRLIELEQELAEVRRQLNQGQNQGVKHALKNLLNSSKIWFAKQMKGTE
ncbi:MAG: glycosyltransferase [Desulfobulbaceae bacterium]|nr:MAG: glycosyltransferase [Desulfobulbaceae bacterium]